MVLHRRTAVLATGRHHLHRSRQPGRLDVVNSGGDEITRGAEIEVGNQVFAHYVVDSGLNCPNNGKPRLFVFDYVFTFGLDGRGSASVVWSFAKDSSCETCTVEDAAGMLKISGP